jgi:hypothetical protein
LIEQKCKVLSSKNCQLYSSVYRGGEDNLKKIIMCLKCGMKLDNTDWEILKYHNKLPICDECELRDSEQENITKPSDSKLRLIK